MNYYILASGSKGNCCLIQNDNTNIIIDCGTTKKYLLDCFEELNYKLEDTNCLLLTHEHIDHIRSIKTFKDINIYSPFKYEDYDFNIIEPYKSFMINDIEILPIELSHDCDITIGFIILDKDEKLVYITDTGYISEYNEALIRNADYYIIESNYDYDMLMKSNRPIYLKKRIHSNHGHMNNLDTAEILNRVIGNKTKEIILAHISMECNDYDLAKDIIKDRLNTNISIRSAKQFDIISKLKER